MTCWYRRPFRPIYRYLIKEKYKKGKGRLIHIKKIFTETKNKNKTLYKCIMANTSTIRQQAVHTTYQLLSISYSTRAMQKSLTLNEKIFENLLEGSVVVVSCFCFLSWENGPLAEI